MAFETRGEKDGDVKPSPGAVLPAEESRGEDETMENAGDVSAQNGVAHHQAGEECGQRDGATHEGPVFGPEAFGGGPG
jgi:hypothetical protein